MKYDKDYKNFVKESLTSNYELYSSYANINIEFDCISSFINITINSEYYILYSKYFFFDFIQD